MAKEALTGKAFIERLDNTFTVIDKIHRAALSSLIDHDEKTKLIDELRTEVNMLLAERNNARVAEAEKLAPPPAPETPAPPQEPQKPEEPKKK